MNAILAHPILAAAIFATCVLLAAATMMVLHRRGKRAVLSNDPERVAQQAEAQATIAHAAAMSQTTAAFPPRLPEYPARLEQRNRAALAARAARTLRRPGVAARWKSQNRVATGI